MIRLYVCASLDGYVADKEGGVGWLEPFNGPENQASYTRFVKDIGAVVMGRVTYEQSLTFGPWPFTTQRTVVVSSRKLADLPPNTEVVPVDALRAKIAELRSREDDTWLMGGGQTVKAFLDLGGLDEIELYVIPVLLGEGTPLFPSGSAPADLEVVERDELASGIVMTRYRVLARSRPARE